MTSEVGNGLAPNRRQTIIRSMMAQLTDTYTCMLNVLMLGGVSFPSFHNGIMWRSYSRNTIKFCERKQREKFYKKALAY